MVITSFSSVMRRRMPELRGGDTFSFLRLTGMDVLAVLAGVGDEMVSSPICLSPARSSRWREQEIRLGKMLRIRGYSSYMDFIYIRITIVAFATLHKDGESHGQYYCMLRHFLRA